MQKQFFCFWQLSSFTNPGKVGTWNLEPWRPVVADTIMLNSGVTRAAPTTSSTGDRHEFRCDEVDHGWPGNRDDVYAAADLVLGKCSSSPCAVGIHALKLRSSGAIPGPYSAQPPSGAG